MNFTHESFTLSCYIVLALTNRKLLLPSYCRLKNMFFLVKLVEYLASAVIVVYLILVLDLQYKVGFFSFYYQHAENNYYQLLE